MALLHNRVNKVELKQKLALESVKRITLSFYRYVFLDHLVELRDALYKEWDELNVKGRIYLAHEGVNAQMSVPEDHFDAFKLKLYAHTPFKDIPFKIAVDDNGKSFYKLTVKVREKIVADGLPDGSYDVSNVGTHLNAEAFNDAMEKPGTVVVDMRNHYESEIGRFEGAITPEADTFREELPMVVDLLKDKKNHKILLYCTGGIRCEKASSYLKHQGFKDVNQLYGGIIAYAQEVKEKGLTSKFKGKNFVFDERLGERIDGEIISKCHQCGTPCDTHTNCANQSCHLLFIQCDACKATYTNCCSTACKDVLALPIETQRALRKVSSKGDDLTIYKSRLRPKIGPPLDHKDKA